MLFLLLLAFVMTPLVLLLGWMRRQEDRDAGAPDPDPAPARKGAAALVAAVAVGMLVYQALVRHQLEQSAALFVGIPAILAIIVILFVSPRNAVGVAMKAITVALLMSALFLWEGVLCIVMAAPLFYAVGAIVASFVDQARRSRNTTALCLAALALAPVALEDAVPGVETAHRETVSATRLVHAPADAVGRAVLTTPRFDRRLPAYLRAGFPRPILTAIGDTDGRQRWTISMRGGEMRINGMEPRTGDLTLDLVESRPGMVRWRVFGDGSHMTHFLFWREARVEWQAIDAETTRVTWTLVYDRGLAPSWYFGPWERYGATLAAAYLIDAVATP